jgi:hypothetical protein
VESGSRRSCPWRLDSCYFRHHSTLARSWSSLTPLSSSRRCHSYKILQLSVGPSGCRRHSHNCFSLCHAASEHGLEGGNPKADSELGSNCSSLHTLLNIFWQQHAPVLSLTVIARLSQELQAEPKEQEVLSVEVAAEVTGAWSTADPTVLQALDDFHVWTPDYLEKR